MPPRPGLPGDRRCGAGAKQGSRRVRLHVQDAVHEPALHEVEGEGGEHTGRGAPESNLRVGRVAVGEAGGVSPDPVGGTSRGELVEHCRPVHVETRADAEGLRLGFAGRTGEARSHTTVRGNHHLDALRQERGAQAAACAEAGRDHLAERPRVEGRSHGESDASHIANTSVVCSPRRGARLQIPVAVSESLIGQPATVTGVSQPGCSTSTSISRA